jgi:hypothetical protein
MSFLGIRAVYCRRPPSHLHKIALARFLSGIAVADSGKSQNFLGVHAMKKAVSLSLLTFAVCAASAHATQDKMAARKEALIKGIQEQLQKTDLRRDGVYNAFKLAKELGYVEVNDDIPYWSTDGGDQLGSMVDIDSDFMILRRTTGWVNKVTQLFCDPSAVVMEEYSRGSYSVANESMKSTACVTIGIESSLNIGALDEEDSFVQRKAPFAPDFSAEVRLGKDGKIDLQYLGGINPTYREKVYISSLDGTTLFKRRDEFYNKNKAPENTYSNIVEHNAYMDALNTYVFGEPVAVINQGSLDKKQILEEMKNVRWATYGNPSFLINLQKAKADLALVSADGQDDAKKLLDLIAQNQSLSVQQKEIELKNGLFGSPQDQAAETACRQEYRQIHKVSAECRAVHKAVGEQTTRRYNFAGTAQLREKIARTYEAANALIAARMSRLDKDPSFFRFIMALSKTERIKN